MPMPTRILILTLALLASSCATYYQRNAQFQEAVDAGELAKAEKMLEGSKKAQRDRNKLLYYLNMGYLNHVQGEFAISNDYFNQADLHIEDFDKNYSSEALALITNPEVKPYKAEDHEAVLIHYYKAINYLMLSDFDGALVEARRMNMMLNRLNDRYKDHKNRYQQDAFAHLVMGWAFEASKEWNDAYIAYRNAYNVYAEGYFGIEAPLQLKKDLLRLADKLGFASDYERYTGEFGLKHNPESDPAFGEALVIWNNGRGPVKDEVNFDFVAVPGQAGYVVFENAALGVSFPVHVGDDKQKRNDLLALKVVRVAFPKFVERPVKFSTAEVQSAGKNYRVERAEDVNAIAFKTLEDRFAREVGSALLRLALKKVTEVKLQQQNEALGALATVTNAVTEKADTRNWQCLPHSIGYARVPLSEGLNTLTLAMSGKTLKGSTALSASGRKGAMMFLPYHSLEWAKP